jgi:hypothetical protein
MPISPFEREVDPRRSGDGAIDPRRSVAAGPEMRASPREQPEDGRADETPEEPGYGHGV